jgi:hypothetical protein
MQHNFPMGIQRPREAQMAKKVMQIGGWYIAYELFSTALLAALAAAGFRLPFLSI